MASKHIHIRDYRGIPGELSADRTTWEFPQVLTTNKRGRAAYWKVYVKLFKMGPNINLPEVPPESFVEIRDEYFTGEPIDLYGWIKVDSGLIGGKVKDSVPTIIKTGKRIGRADATNTFTQALRDALGMYNKQKNKGEDSSNLYPPMLSQVFDDQKVAPRIDDTHPLYVQRKYNGVRAITTLLHVGPTVSTIMYSRRRKIYPGYDNIKDELAPALNARWDGGMKLYIDGELYSHHLSLQDISGAARREVKGNDDIKYMIYDCFVPDRPELVYTQRKAILDELFREFKFEHCCNVETFTAYSREEIAELYRRFLDEKYEGAMIRLDAPYEYSYSDNHSKNILKMKPCYDAEYIIAGYTTGRKGKAAEALMIICRTDRGIEFPVTPAMLLPDRVALAKKMGEVEQNGKTHFENHWLGTEIIVYYDELSKDAVPQRARTKLEHRVD